MPQNDNLFPPIRIACLSGRGLYSHDLIFMLHGLFIGCPITQINHHHLTKSHLSAYNLLVLPGIVGEESPYPDLIPQSKKKTFCKNWLKKVWLFGESVRQPIICCLRWNIGAGMGFTKTRKDWDWLRERQLVRPTIIKLVPMGNFQQQTTSSWHGFSGAMGLVGSRF
jgi:hypothetical protein